MEVRMDIKITRIPPDRLKSKPDKDTPLGFGRIFTDYMFMMKYEVGKGWFEPEIKQFEELILTHPGI